MRCLVVDDEAIVRRSVVRMLEAQGFTCLEAGSGREGLELLAANGELP
jgi:CheY-like chemotaxis protein